MKKYFKNILFINIFPIIVINIIFLPLWIIIKVKLNNTIIQGEYDNLICIMNFRLVITILELLFNGILNPIYLLIINMVYNTKLMNYKYIKNIILMLLSCFLGLFMFFINWCIANDNFFNHDWKDIMILKYSFIFTMGITLIIGLVEQLILIKKYKNKLN
jgi:hypothetical protein